jgi:hypothetical protein
MASLKEGDVVLVTKLDRLGRSTRELLDLIERIGKAGAAFRSLGDPLWDTSSSQGRLLSTLSAAIAEFERDLIRERTGDGRKRAMAKGVKFGRKPKLSDYQRQEAISVPTRGGQTFEDRFLGCSFVEMKGLRIELGGETLDIVSGDFGFATPVPHADFQVVEPFDHGNLHQLFCVVCSSGTVSFDRADHLSGIGDRSALAEVRRH